MKYKTTIIMIGFILTVLGILSALFIGQTGHVFFKISILLNVCFSLYLLYLFIATHGK